MFVSLAGALMPALAGCNECELGQKRCRDNVAEVCDFEYSDSSAPIVWRTQPCNDGACQVDAAGPFCAFGAQRDPRCSSAPETTACDGTALVQCRNGFATHVTDCVSGEVVRADSTPWPASAPAPYCIDENTPSDLTNGAFCSLDPTPSALCPPLADYATRCDGNVLLDCASGYVVGRMDCGAEFCIQTPGYATCWDHPAPDPACPPELAFAVVCDGNVLVECYYGYRGTGHACTAAEVCVPTGVPEAPGAFCKAAP